jgi:ABC-2 type transport system permease protein
MKFLYLLSKDVITFFRDYRNSILLVFMPVFIVLLLGMAFLNTQPTNIPIIICDLDRQDLSNRITSYIENLEAFEVTKITWDNRCQETINDKLRFSAIRAGIVIPENFTKDVREGRSANVTVIIDNTKPVQNFVAFYFRLISNAVSNQLTTELINHTWTNLKNTSLQLEKIKTDLESYDNDLLILMGNLEEVSANVEEIESNFDASLAGLPTISEDIRNAVDSQNIEAEISSMKNTLQRSSQTLSNLTVLAQAMAQDPATSSYATPLLNNITLLQQRITEAGAELNAIEAELKNIDQSLDNSLQKLDALQVTNASSDLKEIISEIEYASLSFNTIRLNVLSLSDKISSTQELFSDLTSKDPGFVAEPVAFSSREAFGELRFIDFLFPGVMIVILMMVSILMPAVSLVRDKSSGLLQRILISPTSLEFIIAEKSFASFVISMLQVPVILLIGIIFFGINVTAANIFPIILVSTIAIFTFVFLGIALASFSKTESTALMAAMLFIIPMIFLSGIFIPVEVMPSFIRDLASILPLSLASRLFQGAMLEGALTANLFWLMAGLVLYIILYAAVAWVTLKKSTIV